MLITARLANEYLPNFTTCDIIKLISICALLKVVEKLFGESPSVLEAGFFFCGFDELKLYFVTRDGF
jgi:hypothetical protein